VRATGARAADPVAARSAEALRLGSQSFAAAARLFDPRMKEDAELLYAWCRHCDDVIDGQAFGHAPGGGRLDASSPAERLAELRAKTVAALAGEPQEEPVFLAFQRVIERHAIPPRLPLDLLEGFRMDVEGHRYRTLDDTLLYAYHVAGSVGLMMALVMGVPPDDADTLDRACDLGLAFQLTNIARDVIEDASAGRVYLPEDWLAGLGLSPADVASPEARGAVYALVVRLVLVADAYYASAAIGMRRLPIRAAMAVGAARAVYRGIGRKLKRLSPSAWEGRVVVSRRRKLALVARGGAKGVAAGLGAERAAFSREGLWTRPAFEPPPARTAAREP